MYHLYAQLSIVMEKPHIQDMAQIHPQKRGPFLGGTMRRIGPRRRGRNWSWVKIFTPNESRAPALHVGMLTSSRECLDKKIWPFVHFSASFYVRIPGYLDRPNSRQWAVKARSLHQEYTQLRHLKFWADSIKFEKFTLSRTTWPTIS